MDPLAYIRNISYKAIVQLCYLKEYKTTETYCIYEHNGRYFVFFKNNEGMITCLDCWQNKVIEKTDLFLNVTCTLKIKSLTSYFPNIFLHEEFAFDKPYSIKEALQSFYIVLKKTNNTGIPQPVFNLLNKKPFAGNLFFSPEGKISFPVFRNSEIHNFIEADERGVSLRYPDNTPYPWHYKSDTGKFNCITFNPINIISHYFLYNNDELNYFLFDLHSAGNTCFWSNIDQFRWAEKETTFLIFANPTSKTLAFELLRVGQFIMSLASFAYNGLTSFYATGNALYIQFFQNSEYFVMDRFLSVFEKIEFTGDDFPLQIKYSLVKSGSHKYFLVELPLIYEGVTGFFESLTKNYLSDIKVSFESFIESPYTLTDKLQF